MKLKLHIYRFVSRTEVELFGKDFEVELDREYAFVPGYPFEVMLGNEKRTFIVSKIENTEYTYGSVYDHLYVKDLPREPIHIWAFEHQTAEIWYKYDIQCERA